MDLVVQATWTRHGDLKWVLVGSGSQVLNSNTVDPTRRSPRRWSSDTVVDYVNSPVGTSTEAMSAAGGRRGRPDHRLRQYVQADAVKAGLSGEAATLPVLSIAAPFNRQGVVSRPGR